MFECDIKDCYRFVTNEGKCYFHEFYNNKERNKNNEDDTDNPVKDKDTGIDAETTREEEGI